MLWEQVRVGAGIEEAMSGLFVASLGCAVKSGVSETVLHVEIGTGRVQDIDNLNVAPPSGAVQRGVPVLVLRVGVGASLEQGGNNFSAAIFNRALQRGFPTLVLRVGIGARREQGGDGFRIGFINGTVQSRCGGRRWFRPSPSKLEHACHLEDPREKDCGRRNGGKVQCNHDGRHRILDGRYLDCNQIRGAGLVMPVRPGGNGDVHSGIASIVVHIQHRL